MGLIYISSVSNLTLPRERSRHFRADGNLATIVLFSFGLLSAGIYYAYSEILQFSSVDDVYTQRFAAADATSGVMGYVRAYHSYFFCPLMVAIGLCDRSKILFVPIGVAGFILSYMVDASKISLVIPLIMIGAGIIFRFKGIRTYHLTAGLSLLCVVATFFTQSVSFVRFVADLVLLRTIAIPAQTFAQYFDTFHFKGYTWWSNITGINAIVPPPAAFQQDRFWPVLGQIVGADYYGSDSRVNLNANPFVGEGIAAGGPIGVIVVSVAIAIFLRAIDRTSSTWNLRVLLVLMVPIGLMLTNVHLSTYMISFGGAAWLVLFRLARPKWNLLGNVYRDGRSNIGNERPLAVNFQQDTAL
ncbi:hypothetical protein IC614_08720 [Allosphingosinicella flava]|uniref:Oligosaccharide repeat unit polymerase n=1 Tax=Allosphingosinicella flava TaxID=2771430 RepID=A0A7T2LLJ1_9SPHN|nr:hypothetical protein IC614_08720 [Sphingosinicella flava]